MTLTLLLAGCAGMASAVDAAASRDSEAEEYSVYAALIGPMFIDDLVRSVVIKDHTTADLPDPDDRAGRLEQLRGKMPALSPKTVRDYLAKNQESHALSNRFDLKTPVVLLSNHEKNMLFQSSSGWDELYAKYPRSQGLMTLSRVGFDPGMRQALVYIGNERWWMRGAGYYVLLVRENNVWSIKDKDVAWINP